MKYFIKVVPDHWVGSGFKFEIVRGWKYFHWAVAEFYNEDALFEFIKVHSRLNNKEVKIEQSEKFE